MENKIYNKYGALRHDTPEAQELGKFGKYFAQTISEFYRVFPNLTPIECRCICEYLSSTISLATASCLLKKVMKMREEDNKRILKKKKTSKAQHLILLHPISKKAKEFFDIHGDTFNLIWKPAHGKKILIESLGIDDCLKWFTLGKDVEILQEDEDGEQN